MIYNKLQHSQPFDSAQGKPVPAQNYQTYMRNMVRDNIGKHTVKKVGIIIFLILLVSIVAIRKSKEEKPIGITEKVISGSFDKSKFKSEEEWKKILTPQQYHILREQGTELPFTGALDHEIRKGTYYSVGCNEPVFRSERKYDSGTGWPSFFAPISPDALVLREDDSFGEKRIEVLDKCGGHLGHLFDDGPPPTGKRYCMNSIALKFVPDKNQQ